MQTSDLLYTAGIKLQGVLTNVGELQLVINDSAQNVRTIVDVLPGIADQLTTIYDEIPNISEKLTAMNDEMLPTIISILRVGCSVKLSG
jgi:hypothetical protein